MFVPSLENLTSTVDRESSDRWVQIFVKRNVGNRDRSEINQLLRDLGKCHPNYRVIFKLKSAKKKHRRVKRICCFRLLLAI